MATSSARLDELKKKFDENPRRYFAPLANEYRKLGDLTQAIALCRAHLPNQPGHISGHIVLAQALYEARELGESRTIFEAALDLDPENLIALRYLGDIAREQGQPLQARGWYERVLDADPRNDEIAALLKALESERARPSEPPPASEPIAEPTATGLDAPSDSFGASVAEAPFPFVHTPNIVPSDTAGLHASAPSDQRAAADAEVEEGIETSSLADPFFGEAEAAPTLAASDLEAAPDPAFDDWFASPTEASASAGDPSVEAPGAGTHDAETAAVEALPRLESIDLGEAETAPDDLLEESFFPDLASVTPPGSPQVPGGATPIDVNAVTPPVVVAQPESVSSIPTPPFLQTVVSEREGGAEPADSSAARETSAGGFELFEPTPSYSSLDPVPEEERPAVPADETAVWEPMAPDRDAAETVADAYAGEPTDDVIVEYGEFVAPAAEEVPYIASGISVPLDEPDAYALGAPALSAHEPFPIEDERSGAADTSDAPDGGAPTPAWSAFQAPVADAAPIDATPVDAPALEETSIQAAPVDVTSYEVTPPYVTAVDAAPVEGLETRDVDAEDAEPAPASHPAFDRDGVPANAEEAPVIAAGASGYDEVDASAATGTPFVTETMAELYLQQGFADEALAIYRQLLAQQPDDQALAQRVAALERGAHWAVGEGVVPRDPADRVGQSVRAFFGHFARRHPGRRRTSAPSSDTSSSDEPTHVGGDVHAPGDATGTEFGAFAGVATREEALTVPDSPRDGGGTASTLTQLFQSGQVSSADERAASALASAFPGDGEREPGRIGDGPLSLEHLFRDVPARSSGAVTLDEFYQGSSPENTATSAGGTTGEPDADIEQFTAWLEGLKKK